MRNYSESLLLGDFPDRRAAGYQDRTVFQSHEKSTSYNELSNEVALCAAVEASSNV